jgi:hypothetical protein
MDGSRFDRLTRTFTEGSSRRGVLRGFATTALGLTMTRLTGTVAARNRKTKKIKRNGFGCVNVGSFCKNAGQCCSGICQGKKGKKRCKAHDASTCQAGQISTECGAAADVACTASSGDAGKCTTTTGNAEYCLADGECFPCKKDADCQAFCGPQAACIPCADDCEETGGTACVGANEGDCGFPGA